MKPKQNRLVVGDASWAADIPQWLLDAIAQARWMEGFIDLLHPEKLEPLASDAEVCAYLMTAAMRAPMPSVYVEIYTWICARVLKARHGRLPKGADFLQEKLQRGLTDYEEYELRDLRATLWTQRGGKVYIPLIEILRELRDHPPSPQLELLTLREADDGEPELVVETPMLRPRRRRELPAAEEKPPSLFEMNAAAPQKGNE